MIPANIVIPAKAGIHFNTLKDLVTFLLAINKYLIIIVNISDKATY
jgi:hypothetical protein